MTFVDALRGLAALAVVLVHASGIFYAGQQTPGDIADWLSQHVYIFSHGVDVFFVISGFVIAHSIGDERVTAAYAGRFAVRRSLRLDPPYWAAIVITIAVMLLRRHAGNDPPPLPTFAQLAAHLVYLQKILGYEHILAVFWTLCLEVHFYLVFILLMMATGFFWRGRHGAAGRIRGWVTVAALAVAMIWPAGLLPSENQPIWFGPHWHKFLIGAVLWYAWTGRLPRYVLWASVLALTVVVSLRRAGPIPADPHYVLGLWCGIVTAAVFAVVAWTDGFYRWLAWWPLQFFGAISYSIYLVHVPVIEIFMGVQKRWMLGSPLGAVVMLAVVFLVTIVVAWLMYAAIEKPSIRLASRFKNKRDDMGGGFEPPASAMAAVPTM